MRIPCTDERPTKHPSPMPPLDLIETDLVITPVIESGCVEVA